MARQKTPEKLVAFLNEFFSMIDDIVDSYELEKIKTIGDCCIFMLLRLHIFFFFLMKVIDEIETWLLVDYHLQNEII
jgi:Adenylate and Guanylate cyclase catalytic domain